MVKKINELFNMDFKDLQFKNLKFVFGILAILFLAVVTVWFGVGISNKFKENKFIGKEAETKNTISVSGSGEIYAKPDLALIDFSVVTEKKTVDEAMAENTKKMNSMIEKIKSQGVEEKDLKTTNFSIDPRYEWLKVEILEGKRILVGYEVNQTLQVKIRDLTKIGNIIQVATDAGANQVGDLQFTIDKQDELKSQTRKEAVEKATAKAKEIAKQLGVKLVKITNFSESEVVPIPRPYSMEKAAGGGEVEALQIQTGENKIEVTVTITYEIE